MSNWLFKGIREILAICDITKTLDMSQSNSLKYWRKIAVFLSMP
jgi:hypothetical protein